MGRWDKEVDSMPDLLNKWWLPQGSGLSTCQILSLRCSVFFQPVYLWTNCQNSIWAITYFVKERMLGLLNWALLEPLMVYTNCSKVLNPPNPVGLIAPINAENRSQQCHCLFPCQQSATSITASHGGAPFSHAFKPLKKIHPHSPYCTFTHTQTASHLLYMCRRDCTFSMYYVVVCIV